MCFTSYKFSGGNKRALGFTSLCSSLRSSLLLTVVCLHLVVASLRLLTLFVGVILTVLLNTCVVLVVVHPFAKNTVSVEHCAESATEVLVVLAERFGEIARTVSHISTARQSFVLSFCGSYGLNAFRLHRVRFSVLKAMTRLWIFYEPSRRMKIG